MASKAKSSGSDAQSGDSTGPTVAEKGVFRWLRLGFVAAISVIAGGAALALVHRKTLNRIREAENQPPDSEAPLPMRKSVKDRSDD
jgi:hypothetical protein